MNTTMNTTMTTKEEKAAAKSAAKAAKDAEKAAAKVAKDAANATSGEKRWQKHALAAGDTCEGATTKALTALFEEFTDYELVKPNHLNQLYLEDDYAANPSSYAKPDAPKNGDIWYEDGAFWEQAKDRKKRAKLGCEPDACIRHKPTGKLYFIECKNQNDAGNAHERACKYATPSMLDAIRRVMGVDYHPMGYIFSGSMVLKKKYILEIQCEFRFARDHLLLWHPDHPKEALKAWFERAVVPLFKEHA